MDSPNKENRKLKLRELEARVSGLQEKLKKLDIPVKRLSTLSDTPKNASRHTSPQSSDGLSAQEKSPESLILSPERHPTIDFVSPALNISPVDGTKFPRKRTQEMSLSGQLQSKLSVLINSEDYEYGRRSGSKSPRRVSDDLRGFRTPRGFPSETTNNSEILMQRSPDSLRNHPISASSGYAASQSDLASPISPVDSQNTTYFTKNSVPAKKLNSNLIIQNSENVKETGMVSSEKFGIQDFWDSMTVSRSPESRTFKSRVSSGSPVSFMSLDGKPRAVSVSAVPVVQSRTSLENWPKVKDLVGMINRKSLDEEPANSVVLENEPKPVGILKRWRLSTKKSDRHSTRHSQPSLSYLATSTTTRPRPASEIITTSSVRTMTADTSYYVSNEKTIPVPSRSRPLSAPQLSNYNPKSKPSEQIILSPIESCSEADGETTFEIRRTITRTSPPPTEYVNKSRNSSVERGRRSSRAFMKLDDHDFQKVTAALQFVDEDTEDEKFSSSKLVISTSNEVEVSSGTTELKISHDFVDETFEKKLETKEAIIKETDTTNMSKAIEVDIVTESLEILENHKVVTDRDLIELAELVYHTEELSETKLTEEAQKVEFETGTAKRVFNENQVLVNENPNPNFEKPNSPTIKNVILSSVGENASYTTTNDIDNLLSQTPSQSSQNEHFETNNFSKITDLGSYDIGGEKEMDVVVKHFEFHQDQIVTAEIPVVEKLEINNSINEKNTEKDLDAELETIFERKKLEYLVQIPKIEYDTICTANLENDDVHLSSKHLNDENLGIVEKESILTDELNEDYLDVNYLEPHFGSEKTLLCDKYFTENAFESESYRELRISSEPHSIVGNRSSLETLTELQVNVESVAINELDTLSPVLNSFMEEAKESEMLNQDMSPMIKELKYEIYETEFESFSIKVSLYHKI
ncbi:hypothetical protein HK096_004403 [Nowakowskiella sp. JEL0078]|nr:hypothetical protein HK096_004403 [Nowakowskiella sp. JEL0078]